jgi:hypothetical protein
MKPKSDEDILNSLENLSDLEILSKSLKYNYFKGVKMILDKNINLSNKSEFNFNLIYNYIFNCYNKEELKYLIYNENLKNLYYKEFVYIIEKYELDLHQNENKDYDIFLNEIFNNLIEKYDNNFMVTKNIKDTNIKKFDIIFLYQDDVLLVDNNVWPEFQKFELYLIEIDQLIKCAMNKNFKRKFNIKSIVTM